MSRLAWQAVRRRHGDIIDQARGLAASEIGLRRPVWTGDRQVVSLQAIALLPGAGENVSNQPLGDGDTAWEVRGLWGRSLGRGQFVDLQIAHRWRGGRDLDEIRFDVSWGWAPAGRWQVIAQSYSVWSAEPARPGRPEFEQHKLQLSVGRAVGAAEYHAGIAITPAGRNALDERAVFLSVWRRF